MDPAKATWVSQFPPPYQTSPGPNTYNGNSSFPNNQHLHQPNCFPPPPPNQPKRNGLLGKLERGLTRLANEVEATVAAQNAQYIANLNQATQTQTTYSQAPPVPPNQTRPQPHSPVSPPPQTPMRSPVPEPALNTSTGLSGDMEGIYEPNLNGPMTREMGMGIGRKADQLKARIEKLEAEGASPERLAPLYQELEKTMRQLNQAFQIYAAYGQATQAHYGMLSQGQSFLHNSTMQGLSGLSGPMGMPAGSGSYYAPGTYFGHNSYHGSTPPSGSYTYQYSYS